MRLQTMTTAMALAAYRRYVTEVMHSDGFRAARCPNPPVTDEEAYRTAMGAQQLGFLLALHPATTRHLQHLGWLATCGGMPREEQHDQHPTGARSKGSEDRARPGRRPDTERISWGGPQHRRVEGTVELGGAIVARASHNGLVTEKGREHARAVVGVQARSDVVQEGHRSESVLVVSLKGAVGTGGCCVTVVSDGEDDFDYEGRVEEVMPEIRLQQGQAWQEGDPIIQEVCSDPEVSASMQCTATGLHAQQSQQHAQLPAHARPQESVAELRARSAGHGFMGLEPMTTAERQGVLQREEARKQADLEEERSEAAHRAMVGSYLMSSVQAEAEYFEAYLQQSVQEGRMVDFRGCNSQASEGSGGSDSDPGEHVPESPEQRAHRAGLRRQGKGIGAGGSDAREQQPSAPLSPHQEWLHQ